MTLVVAAFGSLALPMLGSGFAFWRIIIFAGLFIAGGLLIYLEKRRPTSEPIRPEIDRGPPGAL